MGVMITGLVLFLGVHLVPAMPQTRHRLAERWGLQRYKGVFSAAAGVGLVLIILGYATGARGAQVFAPVLQVRAAAPWIVTTAFILLAASHMRGYLRHVVQHPMIIAVILWSGMHLLANGDKRGTVLFGAFLAWAVIDLIVSLCRGPIQAFDPRFRHDVMAIVGGIVVAGIVMLLHQPLFGVRPFVTSAAGA